ncbi:MAG: hypothetical protein M1812_004344 [Candelaria pacifica]|nr:MAG: hypothetical protein M1812_004344 [Candelaria pacifica]
MPTKNGSDNSARTYADIKGLRRDRPWLLPSNRKLRHLQGIALRNLALPNTSPHTRRTTIDDESLPQSWKSPAKLVAQREHKLEHSRSSNDLKVRPSKSFETIEEHAQQPEIKLQQIRPNIGRLRRRSTLNWVGASPNVRQKKLEDVTGGRMADTWYSLHCAGVKEPVYVSEVVEKAMPDLIQLQNPSFRFFDLNASGPQVSRRDEITVKFWVKGRGSDDYNLLVELQMHLRSLQFIGKSLETFYHPLPANCIVFFLSDGLYTSFTDLPPEEPPAQAWLAPPKMIENELQRTSSYDALMRLSTLDDCIQDALLTRERLASQIDSVLKDHQTGFRTVQGVGQSHESLASTKRAGVSVRKQLKSAIKTRADLQTSLDARREAMRDGRQAQESAQDYLTGATVKLKECESLLQTNTEAMHGQRRRICEDLMRIYPIDPIPHRSLAFTICGLPLPNSSALDTIDEETVAAALGFIAHLIYLLSFYLSVPLPYPIQPHLSTSMIRDTISLMPGQRTFPLFLKGNAQYRFDYAVFLLNKDIELLMNKQGLKVLDLRHTLPNLKYLLYVLTAGNGELPLRKIGGVKGLGVGIITPTLSRQESEESIDRGGEARSRLEMERRSNGGLLKDKGELETGTRSSCLKGNVTSRLECLG